MLNEVGMWTIENQVTYRKLMFYHTIINSDDKRLCKRILMEQQENMEDHTFYMDVKEMASSIGMEFESIKKYTKNELRTNIKKYINMNMVSLVIKSLNMTKLRYVNQPKTFRRKQYFWKMDGYQAIEVIKTRLNMVRVYGNFKGDLTLPRLCQWCKCEDDVTEHFLTCKVVGVCNIKPDHLKNDDNAELWGQINNVIKSNMDLRKPSFIPQGRGGE